MQARHLRGHLRSGGAVKAIAWGIVLGSFILGCAIENAAGKVTKEGAKARAQFVMLLFAVLIIVSMVTQ